MKAYMCQDYETATMAELLGQNLQYGLRNTTKEVPLEEEIHQLISTGLFLHTSTMNGSSLTSALTGSCIPAMF